MPYVNLPPGARGFRMQSDGTHYRAAREGGRVWVEERHVADINGMGGNGDAGLLNARLNEYGVSGAKGKFCPGCGFHAYAFTAECPRCHAEMPPAPQASLPPADGDPAPVAGTARQAP